MDYWKDKYDKVLDYLKENHGASYVLTMLEDLNERTSESPLNEKPLGIDPWYRRHRRKRKQEP